MSALDDIISGLGSTVAIFIPMMEMMCVILVVAYVLTRTRFFLEVIAGHIDVRRAGTLIIVFGLLSIYGTYTGETVEGAPINIRDFGPMMAGLLAGPVVGVGAGLIGALYRFSLEGVSQVPCSLATVLAGLFAGLLYIYADRSFLGWRRAVVFAVLMECFHMLLVLLLVQPFDVALEIVEASALPMIVSNALGIGLFSMIVENSISEKETERERDEYQGELERKRAELSIARDIQRSFLPSHVPEISGYDIAAINVPAKEVGGDFYDFIPMPDGKVALVIADVSGKGVPAALYMALSRTVLRATAARTGDPEEAIRRTNAIIAEDSESGMFVTMFYAEMDAGNHLTTFINAGHNPPMLIRRDGQVLRLTTDGIALGALDEIEVDSMSMGVAAGDIVAFYTDGVTEAIDADEEEFGEDRLLESVMRNSGLDAQGIVDAVHAEVMAFCGEEPQFDDITLMVLKVEDDEDV